MLFYMSVFLVFFCFISSHSHIQMGDAVLSSVEEKIIVNKDSVESSDRFEAVLKAIDAESSLIPTAIVKPKYQKLAFDERQLPIIGSTDDDSSWFNNSSGNTPSSTTTTITTTPRKVQKHLPNFDRRSQKSFSTKHTRKLVDYTVSDKEAINSLRHSEKDIDCSVSNSNFNNQVSNSVAIVQPLKKNDMNTNCFDKHLDHPQLNVDSKNSSMSDKHEQNVLRNNSKINNQNITSLNSLHDYGNNNNLNIDSKSLDVKCFDLNKNNMNNINNNNINNNNNLINNNNNNNSASGSVTNDTKKKAATIKKELSKDNTGNYYHI